MTKEWMNGWKVSADGWERLRMIFGLIVFVPPIGLMPRYLVVPVSISICYDCVHILWTWWGIEFRVLICVRRWSRRPPILLCRRLWQPVPGRLALLMERVSGRCCIRGVVLMHGRLCRIELSLACLWSKSRLLGKWLPPYTFCRTAAWVWLSYRPSFACILVACYVC